jgi:trk system potassium uptake protein
MHVIVLGAGRVGQYVAQSLTLDGHSVVLVDMSKERLEEASLKSGISTKRGVGTDWRLLESLMEEGPSLLLALTNNDEINLVACAIAKSLGKNLRTVARIRDFRYLGLGHFDTGRIFHVDHLVIPELLVAEQIVKITLNKGLYSESFFHGGVLLRTVQVPLDWKHAGKTLAELKTSDRQMIIAIIRRKIRAFQKEDVDEIIFPHGDDVILGGDEVTVIGNTSLMQEMQHFLGTQDVLPRSAIIFGGTLVGSHLARSLQKRGIAVTLIEASTERCYKLAEELPGISIIQQQGSEWDSLKAAQVESADVFIAVSDSENKNMQVSLFAKELGCNKVIAELSTEETCRLAEKLSISHVVSPRIATTDRILSLAKAEKVTSIISLYDQRAEIIEAKVSVNSPVIGIPLSVLGTQLPKELLIAVIHNRGRIFVAGGSHILAPHDEVIVVCSPNNRHFLEKIF